MKLFNFLTSALIVAALTGCHSVPTVPLDSNQEQGAHSLSAESTSTIYFINKSHQAKYLPFMFRVGSENSAETPYKTYSKFIVEPGKHWISATHNQAGLSNSSCQLIEANKDYYFKLSFTFSPKLSIATANDLAKIKKTAFNNSVAVKPMQISYDPSKGVAFISNSNSLDKLKETLEKKYINQQLLKNDGLEAHISIAEQSDGSRIGRYLTESEAYKATQVIFVEFHLNGEVVDSIKFAKEVQGGIFGGGIDGLVPAFADDLASYIDCVFDLKSSK